MNGSIRVIARHRLSKDLKDYDSLKKYNLSHRNQLTWGVIKFLILKDMGNFKNKRYNFDIDGRLLQLNMFDSGESTIATKTLEVTDTIPNNTIIVYNRVPLQYNETVHFIPHLALEFTSDIDESKINVQYY